MAVWMKPPGIPRVNNNHPLAKDLILCVVPEWGELLTQTPPTIVDTHGVIGAGQVGLGVTSDQSGGASTGGIKYVLPSWAPIYNIGSTWSAFMVAQTTTIGSNFRAHVGIPQLANGDNPYYGWSPFNAYGDTAQGIWCSIGGSISYYNGLSAWFTQDGSPHNYYVESVNGTLLFDRDGVLYNSTGTISAGTPGIATNKQPLWLGCTNQLSGLGQLAVAGTIFLVLAFSRTLSASERVYLAANPFALLDYQDDYGVTTWFVPSGGAPPFNPANSLVPQAPQLPPIQRMWAKQQAWFAPPLPPDSRKVPWTGPYFPRPPVRPKMLPSEQMATSPRELVPERPSAYSEGVSPRTTRRALEHARHQAPFADPTYGWALAIAAPAITPPAWPDTVRRPAMPAAEQRADAPRVPLDRPFPQVDGAAPDMVLRPRMLAGEQQALAAPPAPPDARTVPWSASTTPDAVRRPTFAAAQQRAWTDGTYAQFLVVVPAITPPAFPEAVRRPSFRAEQQRAFTATTTTDRPYPQFAPGVAPDRVYRPQFLAALQQALALQPRPERTAPLTSVVAPDRVERPAMRAALQQAYTKPVYTDRSVPLWCVVAPDVVLRPRMLAAEQLAAAGMRVPDAPVPAPDLVALCYPSSVGSVLRLTAARMPSAFMPPWRYTHPIRPGGRARANPGDAILDSATTSDSTGATGDPSDE